MTYTAVALLWLASGYRIHMARKRASFITISYCVAAVGITAAFTIKATEVPLDRATTANLSDLLEHLLVVVGGVAAQLFLLALRDGRPGRNETISRAAIASLVGAVMIGLFIAAPIHTTETDLDATYGSLGVVNVYRLVFNAYLTYVLIDNVRLCWRYAAVPGDAGRTASLHLVGWGSLIAIGYSTSRLIYAMGDITMHARLSTLHTLGSAAAAIGLCGIALGVLAPTIVITSRRWRDAMRGLRQLDGLWKDLTAQFPDVVLPTGWPVTPRRAELRHDRHLIEIAEGLARVHLPVAAEDLAQNNGDVLDRIGDALRHYGPGWSTEGGTATTVLIPKPADRAQEDEQITRLAAAYGGPRKPKSAATAGVA